MRLSLAALLLLMSASVFSQDCFERAGRDYGINADLLRAISFRESSWRSDALNIVSPESYAVGAYNAGFRETDEQERKRLKYAQEVQAIYENIKKNTPPT